MKSRRDYLQFSTAGHTQVSLFFFPGPTRCGKITDGVALCNGNTGDWVVDYTDLKAMYDAATEARAVRQATSAARRDNDAAQVARPD